MLTPFFPIQTCAPEGKSLRQYITPAGLVAYGLMSNALFWSGLLLPYNANSAPHIAYLHVFVVLMGVALAVGGALATLMVVTKQVSVPYYSLEFAAGLLSIFVLTTAGTLLLHAFIRSL